MLDTLRSRWPGFAVLLDTLALAPLPEAAAARAASLNSRAWLLKVSGGKSCPTSAPTCCLGWVVEELLLTSLLLPAASSLGCLP